MKLSKGDSAKLVTKEVLISWEMARIPTKDVTRCAEQINKLYDVCHIVWDGLRKHSTRSSDAHKNAEKQFNDNLDDLFDVAHADALQQIKNQEDKDFLQMQRQKGRPGCMIGTDMKTAGIEQRAAERQQKEQERKRKHNEMMQECGMISQFYY